MPNQMNQNFNMQDVMRMAMMQQGQQGGMHAMPGGAMMPNAAMGGMTGSAISPEEYMRLMKQMQMQQMAMQMMQQGQPGQQQGMAGMMPGLMQQLGK